MLVKMPPFNLIMRTGDSVQYGGWSDVYPERHYEGTIIIRFYIELKEDGQADLTTADLEFLNQGESRPAFGSRIW